MLCILQAVVEDQVIANGSQDCIKTFRSDSHVSTKDLRAIDFVFAKQEVDVIQGLCNGPPLIQIVSGIEICHGINEDQAHWWLHADAICRA